MEKKVYKSRPESRHWSSCRICGTRYKGRKAYCSECINNGAVDALNAIKKEEREAESLIKKEKKLAIPKICLKCGKEFYHLTSRHCSVLCAKSREQTPEMLQKKRIKTLHYCETPEGIAKNKKTGRLITDRNKGKITLGVSFDEYMVDIPVIIDKDYYEDCFEGYNLAEDW